MIDLETAPDDDVLARTLFGEARGEGQAGMQAVANVILHRFALWDRHPHFGTGTIASVCLAPWQFSCWNENDPNRALIEAVTAADPAFARCTWTAADALAGLLADNTNGATYYFAQGSPVPAWAEGKTPCATIGRHLFFKGVA